MLLELHQMMKKLKNLIEKHEFDDAINYNKHSNYNDFLKILKEKCPKGVDKYFDNVGGYQTDAIVQIMNVHGRIIICGQISSYNDKEPVYPKFQLSQLIYKNIRIEGIIVSDFFKSSMYGDFKKEMTEWVLNGKIKAEETVFEGFDKIPEAFLSLFSSQKNGKVIIKI